MPGLPEVTIRLARRARAYVARLTKRYARGVSAARLASPDAEITRHDPANAFSLNEPGMPRRLRMDGRAIGPLHDFVKWANVENPDHKRWYPSNGRTFCNIYAHDYCHAAGVYLPRVWWMADAIQRQLRLEQTSAVYGQSVYEMDANGLYEWLVHWGPAFGWKRARSLEHLQGCANRGAVALISAANADWRAPGHIAIVLPENRNARAIRANSQVFLPLVSETGVQPMTCGTPGKEWWRREPFDRFGLFYNLAPSSWRD